MKIAVFSGHVYESSMRNLLDLPSDLPIPSDDGAAHHLEGKEIPEITLVTHLGKLVPLVEVFSSKTVLFTFPRAGNTLSPNPAVREWDLIPGARGCTPQSCGYRDLTQDFEELGFQVFGLSVQSPEILNEVATKNHLTFDLLSDSAVALTDALRLPTFDFHGERLIKRMTLLVDGGRIFKIFYPVFPPDQNAAEVLSWIRHHRGRQ